MLSFFHTRQTCRKDKSSSGAEGDQDASAGGLLMASRVHVTQTPRAMSPERETCVKCRPQDVCVSVILVVFLSLVSLAAVATVFFLAHKLWKRKNLTQGNRERLDGSSISTQIKNTSTDDLPEQSDSYESVNPDDCKDNDSIYSSVDSYASINQLNDGQQLQKVSSDDKRNLPNSQVAKPPPPLPPKAYPPTPLRPSGAPSRHKAKFSEPLPLPPSELPSVFDLDSSTGEHAGERTFKSALRNHRLLQSRLIESSIDSLVE